MRALSFLFVLAGCETGVAIEVRTPAGTDEVALFLATTPCPDCSPIQPPLSNYTLDGRFYQRDGASLTAPVDETGSAWFRFQPSDTESSFDVVLAVGLLPLLDDDLAFRRVSGSTILFDLDVYGPRQVVIEVPPQVAGGPEAKVWESAGTDDVCAAYVDGRPEDAIVVVPTANPDCDSVAGSEDCNEFSHETNVPRPAVEGATCLAAGPIPALDPQLGVCMLGGEVACSEDECAPTNYCAPIRSCAGCASSGVFECIAAGREGLKIVCDVPVARFQGQNVVSVCDRDPVTVPLPIPQCTSIDVALADGVAPVQFGDKVDVTTGGGRVLSVKTKAVDPTTGRCVAEIDVEGEYMAEVIAGLAAPVVARIDVENLAVAGAVVPVILKPVQVVDNLCSSSPLPLSCNFEVTSDASAACLGVPTL